MDVERFVEDDFPDDDRLVVKSPAGFAAVLPTSARRLSMPGLELYAQMNRRAAQIQRLDGEISGYVDQARDAGMSWSVIGAAVGLTGEGARLRYSLERDDT